MNRLAKAITITLLAAWTGAATFSALAQTTPPATNKPPVVKKARTSRKFSGTIAAVDNDAKTITLEGASKKQIQITSKTKISKDGQPATLADAAVGMGATGFGSTNSSGVWMATSLRLTAPKPAAADTKQ